MASILEVSKELQKKYKGNQVLIAGDMLPEIKTLSFGVLSADYPLEGGLPYGSIVEISGQFSSGKTTLAAMAVAQWQKEHPEKTCVWVDAESSARMQFPHFKKMLGFKPENVLVYDATGISAENVFADIIDLQTGVDDIGLIVLDSVASLISDQDLETDFEKDNGQRAAIAKSVKKFMRFIKGWIQRKGNILIVINQTMVTGTTFTGAKIYDEPCGAALKFFPDVKIRCGTRTFIKDDKNDLATSKAEGATGYRINFNVMKSKKGAITKGGGFVSFDFESGIDDIIDTIEVAIKCGYIQRPTMQSYCLVDLNSGEILQDEDGNELKFVGKQKLIDFIKNNPKFKEEYFKALSKHLDENNSGVSLLEQEQLEELFKEEESVK